MGLKLTLPSLRSFVVLSSEQMAMTSQVNQVTLFVFVATFARYFGKNASAAEARLEESRAQSEALLLNILPRQIADSLKATPGFIAERFDEATILFADLVNFTELSERLPAAQLVEMLDTVFSKFDVLADKWNLEKIKTIGDAYMVAGGIPDRRPGHLESIANMTLDMQRVMETLTLPGSKGLSAFALGSKLDR